MNLKMLIYLDLIFSTSTCVFRLIVFALNKQIHIYKKYKNKVFNINIIKIKKCSFSGRKRSHDRSL